MAGGAGAGETPEQATAMSPPISAAAVAERLAGVRRRIETAAPDRRVEVVAVTKGLGPDAVDAAVGAGLTAIGENYAQELLAKTAAGAGGVATRWHFIGALQRNKVAALAPHVVLWQTVDRPSVAEAIARHAPGAAALVQVRLSPEGGRSGCSLDDAPLVVGAARAAGLDVRGLMGVGPMGTPEASRQAFAALAAATRRLGLAEVSMGMSGDLEVAVAEGSTMVRVGTALFGPRPGRDDLRR